MKKTLLILAALAVLSRSRAEEIWCGACGDGTVAWFGPCAGKSDIPGGFEPRRVVVSPDGRTDAPKSLSDMRRLVVESSAADIPDGTFAGCTGLEEVVFFGGDIGGAGECPCVGACAFSGCSRLERVVFRMHADRFPDIMENSFEGCSPSLTAEFLAVDRKSRAVDCDWVWKRMREWDLTVDWFAWKETPFVFDGRTTRYTGPYFIDGTVAFAGLDGAAVVGWDGVTKKVFVPDAVAGVPVTEVAGVFRDGREVCLRVPATVVDFRASVKNLLVDGKMPPFSKGHVSGVAWVREMPDARPSFQRTKVLPAEFASADFLAAGMDEARSGNASFLVKKSGKLVLTGFSGNADLVELPAKIDGRAVDSVLPFAFADKSLRCRTLVLPEGFAEIGECAFSSCEFAEVRLPGSLRRIGKGAFAWCEALADVRMAEGLEAISTGAFLGCGRLSFAPIPSTVREVGFLAFSGCTSLGTPMRLVPLDAKELAPVTIAPGAFPGK